MSSNRNGLRYTNFATYRYRYKAELARGSSHIASTLTSSTRAAAIAEVVSDFRELHGSENLLPFLELLAEALEKRNSSDAAAAVRNLGMEESRRSGERDSSSARDWPRRVAAADPSIDYADP